MNDSQSILYQDCIPGGAHWSMLMRRGTQLRLTDVEGGAKPGDALLQSPQSARTL